MSKIQTMYEITKTYRVRGIAQPLFLYHQHEGEQITSSGKKALDGYLKIYKKIAHFPVNDL